MPDARCANQSNFVRSSQDKKAKFFGVKSPGRKNRNWSSYSIDRVSDEMLDKARKQNFHILCSHYLDWNWFYRDIQTWNRNFLVTASSLKQVLSGWLFWYVYLIKGLEESILWWIGCRIRDNERKRSSSFNLKHVIWAVYPDRKSRPKVSGSQSLWEW